MVTSDISILTVLKGYWSGEGIYINKSEHLVLIKPETTAGDIVEILKEFTNEKLFDWIKAASYRSVLYQLKVPNKSRKFFSQFLCSLGFSFVDVYSFRTSTSTIGECPKSRSAFIKALFHQGHSPEKIAEIMALAWLSRYRSTPYSGIYPAHLPLECSLLGIPWDAIPQTQAVELLHDLWRLACADLTLERFGHNSPKSPNSRAGGEALLKALTAEERSLFAVYGGKPVDTITPSHLRTYLLTITNAARQALLLLVKNDICLLPYGFATSVDVNVVGLAAQVLGHKLLDGHFNPSYSFQAAHLLACTNMKSIADFPVNITHHLPPKQVCPAFAATFTKPLKEYAVKNSLKEYPYRTLKRYKESGSQMFSPQWAKENCPQEWADFIDAFWGQSQAGDAEKSLTISGFFRWAYNVRGFKSVYDIQPEDIRNPYMDSEEETFFEYLSRQEVNDNNKSKKWAHGARLFSLVANSAKLPGSPVFGRVCESACKNDPLSGVIGVQN